MTANPTAAALRAAHENGRRELLAEVTAALVEQYPPNVEAFVDYGERVALVELAGRLGIDLDAALSTPPAPTEEVQ